MTLRFDHHGWLFENRIETIRCGCHKRNQCVFFYQNFFFIWQTSFECLSGFLSTLGWLHHIPRERPNPGFNFFFASGSAFYSELQHQVSGSKKLLFYFRMSILWQTVHAWRVLASGPWTSIRGYVLRQMRVHCSKYDQNNIPLRFVFSCSYIQEQKSFFGAGKTCSRA